MSGLALVRRPTVLVALALFLAIGVVWGAVAAHSVGTPSLDDRVHAVAAQLQCPVCHNGESAADSSSEEAAQMRALIRRQLLAGKTPLQIVAYFHERYGDAILESPPKQGFTALIWIAPLLMLLAGLGVVIAAARQWRPAPAGAAIGGATGDVDEAALAALDALAPEERTRLAEALRRELAAEEGFAHADGNDPAAQTTTRSAARLPSPPWRRGVGDEDPGLEGA